MSALSLDWLPLCRHYMPEILQGYTELYVGYRNRGHRLDYQTPYELDTRRYNTAFWEDVFHEHFIHRFAVDNTIPFLHKINGYSLPWPDMLRRLPGMLRADSQLYTRYRLNRGRPSSVLGQFEPFLKKEKLGQTIKKIEAGIKEDGTNPGETANTMICYYMMTVPSWCLLTDIKENRLLVSDRLSKLLEEGQMEEMESRLGPYVADFFRVIGSAPPHDPPIEA